MEFASPISRACLRKAPSPGEEEKVGSGGLLRAIVALAADQDHHGLRRENAASCICKGNGSPCDSSIWRRTGKRQSGLDGTGILHQSGGEAYLQLPRNRSPSSGLVMGRLQRRVACGSGGGEPERCYLRRLWAH